MPTTARYRLRYPAAETPPNGPGQIGDLAADVDAQLTEVDRKRSGHLLTKTQTSAVTNASSTTRVPLPNVTGSVALASPRRVLVLLTANRCSGTAGGELGRLELRIDGAPAYDNQWQIGTPGTPGTVGSSMSWSTTLTAGTHTFEGVILRVSGGTSVTVNGGQLSVWDGGPA